MLLIDDVVVLRDKVRWIGKSLNLIRHRSPSATEVDRRLGPNMLLLQYLLLRLLEVIEGPAEFGLRRDDV